MILTEKQMLKRLNSKKTKKVLLVEPNYKSTHPPLGLAKIKTYLLSKGKEVKFARTILPEKFDLICITTLFTYYSAEVFDVIKNRGLFNMDTPILVGGIFASMMPEQFDQFDNLDLFRGYSKTLDLCIPDPELMSSTEDPQWHDYSYVFTSRGCPNKCGYCVVWRIEKKRWINPEWRKQVDLEKPYIMLSDNNLSAVTMEHLKEIVDFAVEHDKKMLFNSGFDCKYMTDEMAKELARLKFCQTGMRLAFDRIEEDGVFQTAIKKLIKAGVPPSKIEAYVLFNFVDTPKDAVYRARACADLKISPYPQCYTPLNTLNKKKNRFVGKHWTMKLGNAFRFFWLLRGLYNKQTFEEFLYLEKTKNHFKLEKKDYAAWENSESFLNKKGDKS